MRPDASFALNRYVKPDEDLFGNPRPFLQCYMAARPRLLYWIKSQLELRVLATVSPSFSTSALFLVFSKRQNPYLLKVFFLLQKKIFKLSFKRFNVAISQHSNIFKKILKHRIFIYFQQPRCYRSSLCFSKNLNSIKKCLNFPRLINSTEPNYAIERIIVNVETTFRRF